MEDNLQQSYARAAREPSKRALRVCAIVRGRVICERRLACDEALTVGRSSRDTITYPDWPLSTSMTLAEKVGGHYALYMHPELSTEVTLEPGRKVNRSEPAANVDAQGNVERIAMSEKSTVKVQAGSLSILFHCVDPLPELPHPKLPAQIAKRVWGAGDKLYWMAALVALVIEFGGMGYMHTIPRPEPVMEDILKSRWAHYLREPTDSTPSPALAKQPTRPVKASAPQPREGAAEEPMPPKKRVLSTDQRAKVSRAVLAQMSLGGGGVLRQLQDLVADTSIDAHDDAFEGVERPGNAGLPSLGPRGDEVGEIAGVGPVASRRAKRLKRPVNKKRRRPKVKLRDKGPDRLGVDGQVDEEAVARTIRSRLPLLQACYSKALKRNPSLAGRMELEIELGTGGRVVDAVIREDSIGSERVSSCVLSRVSTWRFGVQVDDSAFVTIPLIFQPGDG